MIVSDSSTLILLAKAQVLEILTDVGYRQIAPDVIPFGIFQDAGDEPSLLKWATAAQDAVDFLFIKIVIPQEIKALV